MSYLLTFDFRVRASSRVEPEPEPDLCEDGPFWDRVPSRVPPRLHRPQLQRRRHVPAWRGGGAVQGRDARQGAAVAGNQPQGQEQVQVTRGSRSHLCTSLWRGILSSRLRSVCSRREILWWYLELVTAVYFTNSWKCYEVFFVASFGIIQAVTSLMLILPYLTSCALSLARYIVECSVHRVRCTERWHGLVRPNQIMNILLSS